MSKWLGYLLVRFGACVSAVAGAFNERRRKR